MQEISIQGNSDYIWVGEFAKKLGITPSAVSHWLTLHADLKALYTKKYKAKLYLHKDLLSKYIARKGNSGQTRIEVTSSLNEAKDKLAEKAMANISTSSDPILGGLQQMLAIRQEQLNQGQRLDNLENKIEEVKRLAIEVPPETMTNPEREYLNERVRYYAHQTEVPHWRIWGKLHSLVGRPEIGKYRSQDYKLAMKYLRTWYKEAEIEWN